MVHGLTMVLDSVAARQFRTAPLGMTSVVRLWPLIMVHSNVAMESLMTAQLIVKGEIKSVVFKRLSAEKPTGVLMELLWSRAEPEKQM